MLLGIAIRTGSPLSLSLAEPVWKQLAGEQLNVSDLTEIDKDYVPGNRTNGFFSFVFDSEMSDFNLFFDF